MSDPLSIASVSLLALIMLFGKIAPKPTAILIVISSIIVVIVLYFLDHPVICK